MIDQDVPGYVAIKPLLFICYINYLPQHCMYTVPFIYADDTAFLCSGKNPDEVQQNLQNELNRLSNWFAMNRPSVNCTKTNSVRFTSSRSKFKNNTLELTVLN